MFLEFKNIKSKPDMCYLLSTLIFVMRTENEIFLTNLTVLLIEKQFLFMKR